MTVAIRPPTMFQGAFAGNTGGPGSGRKKMTTSSPTGLFYAGSVPLGIGGCGCPQPPLFALARRGFPRWVFLCLRPTAGLWPARQVSLR